MILSPHVTRVVLVVVVAGSLVLGALGTRVARPAPAGPTVPTSGGTLTIAFVPFATHIDVSSSNIGTIGELAHYFYETLYDRDGHGQVKGLLVKEDQVSADGLTWTWRLQPNVRFHDGSPFNAMAVKWNFDRKFQKRLVLYDLLPFKSVEVVDDLTVRVGLSRPAPNLRSILVTKTFSMYSPVFAQQVGDDALRSQASGTGPFVVVDFRPNEILRMRKNPNYWQKGLPYLDEIVFRVVPDATARAAMLEAGDADVALALSVPDLQRLKTRRGLKVQQALGSQQYYVTINNRKPPFNDVRVRRALNHAVDKQGIINTVFLGNAKPATAFYINPTVDGHVHAGTYDYNPDKARRLLDEAGLAMGPGGVRLYDGRPLSLEFVTRKGATPGDFEMAELVQGMLRAVGIDARLTVRDSATFISRTWLPPDRATYDLVNLAFGTFTGDAEYVVRTAYHSTAVAPRFFNWAFYSNPIVDSLIDESMKATTSPGRNRIYYSQIIRQVFQDAPAILLVDITQRVAMKDIVHGVYLERAANTWPAKYAWKEKR